MLTLRRAVQLGLIVLNVALLFDVLHRASHAPWRCSEDCRWWQIWPDSGD